MNSPHYYPIRIGNVKYEVSESSIKSFDIQKALSSAHRKEITYCLCNETNPTKLIVKCYGANTESMHYGLARWRDTGIEHNFDCIFFGEEESDRDGGDSKPAFEELSSGKWHVHLSTALSIIERNIENIKLRKTASASNPKTTQQKANDVSLLLNVWRKANLNLYRGKLVRWYNATFQLLKTIDNFQVNKKGDLLSKYLLIGGHSTDKLAIEHNRAVLKATDSKLTRLFVIGRLQPFGRDKNKLMLRFKDFAGLPRISIRLEQLDHVFSNRAFYQNLLNDPNGNVIAIACIESTTSEWWTTINLSVIATSENMIPVESSYELEFERYLVQHNRTFVKPLVLNETSDDVKRPDFILLDTEPRTFVEVWGMQTPEYLADKQRKINEYQSNGKALLSWTANPREDFPPLPSLKK